MTEQAISAALAWLVVAVLFTADVTIVAQRKHVPWDAAFALGVGTLMLATAGAVTATNALDGNGLAQEWVWFVVVTRAMTMAIFAGVLMRLTMRPRWLIRSIDAWLAR